MSISSQEFNDAISALSNEINELNRLKKLLLDNEFNSNIDEETYHNMCLTDLRCTDILGQALGTQLGFIYDKRSPNYFHYKLPNGWKLLIPSTSVTGVEIVVPKYYHKDITKDIEWQYKYIRIHDIRELLDNIENKFFEGNFIDRATYTFGNRYKHSTIGKAKMIVRYAVSRPFNNYSEQYHKQYTQLKKEEIRISNALCNTVRDLQNGRKAQELSINMYCEQLFKWTDTVRIYVKDGTTAIEVIKK